MQHSSINEFSWYLAGLSEFARLLVRQRFVVLRDRTLIIYCADGKELEETLGCISYLAEGLKMTADSVVLKVPDYPPIILLERCCRMLDNAKLARTRTMLEELLST